MKKTLLYSIITIFLLILVIVGSTYAFFSSATNRENSVSSISKRLAIDYNGGTPLSGSIPIVASKEGGNHTAVTIKLGENSVAAKADVFISIEEISQNLRISGFVWDVVGEKNGVQVYTNHGTFEGYNDTDNKIVTIVSDYLLSTDLTTFTVYLWLDGNNNTVNNNILGGSFKGFIAAKSEAYSATLSGN